MRTMPSNTPGTGRRDCALAVLLLFVFFCLPTAQLRAAPANSGTFSMATANVVVTADESDALAGTFSGIALSPSGLIGAIGPKYEPLGASVTIVRTGGSAGRVSVVCTLTDGTALAGVDYKVLSLAARTVIFENGQTYTNIVIPIQGNGGAPNLNATNNINGTGASLSFTVNVSSAVIDNSVSFNNISENALNLTTPAWNAASKTTVTINSLLSPTWQAQNGVAPTTPGFVSFGRGHYVRKKNSGLVQIAVVRTGLNVSQSVTVLYRVNSFPNIVPDSVNSFPQLTPGSDYAYPGTNYVIQGTPGTVSFGVNQTVAYIPIQIIDNPDVDQNLDIEITLDNTGNPASPSQRFVQQVLGSSPAAGLAIGLQSTTILTILAHEQANSAAEPQPAGAVDIGYNMDDVLTTSPPYNVNPGANGPVYAVAVQPNQSTIVAGDFTAVNTTPRNRIARMTANGQLDTTFDPQAGADNFINTVALQSNGAILIGGGFTSINGTSRNGIARLNSDGSLDTTFNPGSGINPGSVSASAIQSIALQSNGQIIIGGNFTTYNGTPINRIARLNSDGSLDATFNPGTGPNATVYALAVQSDGNILLGGLFTAVNATTLNGIARLTPTGSIDANFDPGSGVNGAVYAIGLQSNGQILLGGSFTTIDLRSSPSIGRINTNGSVDTSFYVGTGPDNTVYSVKYDPTTGNIYIGGVFMNYHGTPRLGVARLLTNGTLDTTFMDTVYNQYAGLVNPLYSMPANSCFSIDLLTSGNVMIGGSFNKVGGGATRQEARLRANFCRLVGGSTPGPGHFEFTSPTYTMDEYGGPFFATVARNNGGYGQAYVNVSTADQTAVSGVNYSVSESLPPEIIWRSIYSVPFTSVSSFVGRRIADAITGPNNNETGNQPWNILSIPLPIVLDDLTVTPIPDHKVTGNLNFTGILALPPSLQTINLGGVQIPQGVALGRDTASFTIVDGDYNYGNLSFSNPTYSYFENGGNAVITVYRTGGSSGTITAQYATVGGTAAPNTDYVPVSGTLTFAPGQTNATFNVPLLDSLIPNPTLTINLQLWNPTGGASILPNGTNTATINELNNNPAGTTPAGSVNTAFNYGVGADGNVLAVSYLNLPSTSLNRQWLIGGNFQNVGGLSRNYFARLNRDGSPDSTMTNLTTGANGTVNAIAVYPDVLTLNAVYPAVANLAGRIVVGGAFTTFNSTNRNCIVRLNVDGGVDSSFNPGAGADNVIYAVAVVTNDVIQANIGKVVAVGDFASFNGSTRSHIVRLNKDGSVDNTFNPGQGADSSIRAVALATDGSGKIIIGGDFTSYNATPISRVARLNSDGSLDTSFIVLPAAGAGVIPPGVNGRVRTVAVDFTNNVVIGGDFTTISVTNNTPLTVNRVTRLLTGDGTPDTAFNTNVLVAVVGADQPVYALTVEPDYKLIIVGDFATYNGIGRTRIARLNTDGSLDPTINFGSGPNGFVASLALDTVSTNITIGGGFTMVNGFPRNYYAELVSGANVGIGNFVFTTNNFNVLENGTNVVLTISRLGGLSNFVQVTYGSTDGTAFNTVDYTNNPVTTNLKFGPGQSIQTVTIGIIPGTATNVNHIFTNTLANPLDLGANGLTSTAAPGMLAGGTTTTSTTTIINNNSQFNFSVANFSVVKSVVGGNAVITVNRDGGPVGTVTVNYATSNLTATTNDYTTTTGTLTFTNGQTSATFLVPILDNLLAQQDLTVLLTLSSPTGAAQLGGRPTATLTIVNNTFAPGTLYFSSANYSFNESGLLATINVNRTNGNSGIITVGYATSDSTALAYPGTGPTLGYQYIGTNGTISFADGETSKSFTVTLIDNHVVEGNLTFNLSLLNPTGGASLGSPNSAVVTILDNDFTAGTLSLSTNQLTTIEQIGTLTSLVVHRLIPTTGAVSVSVSATDGTAISGKDYVLLTNSLSWADADGADKIIPITINTQAVINPDRQFTVNLSNPLGGSGIGVGSCVVTIHTTNTGPGYFSFTAANYGAFESVGVAPITIIRTNGTAGQVTIVLGTNAVGGTAAAGVDYTNNFSVNPNSTPSGFPVNIVFTNGQATQTVNLGIVDRHILDGDRTLNLQLSTVPLDLTAPNLGMVTNSVFTILDDSPAAGSIDTSFVPNTGPNNKVNGLALQNNGKVVVGGDFTTVDGQPRNHIARLNSDGTVDTAFNPGNGVTTANGTVRSVGIQSDGKVVFGGLFTTVNGSTRNNLARLNSDGSLDTSFTGNFANNPVNSVMVQSDGKILVGGNFTTLSGTNWNFIGRLTTNGAPDTAFNPGVGPNGQVRAIALQPDGRIVIGGDFTSFNGVACNYVTRLNSDGSLDNTFSSGPGIGPNFSVYALAVQLDGRIVVGGAFTGVGTNSVPYLARLNANGVNDAANFAGYTGVDNIINSIAMDATSRIIIGGSFGNVDGLSRSGLARLNTDGSVDLSLNTGAGANAAVNSVAYETSDGKIVLGGGFTAFDGTPRNYVARLNGGSNPGSGSVDFSAANYTYTNGSPIMITVLRHYGLSNAVSVGFTTLDGTAFAGTNYVATNGTISIPQGVTSATFPVSIIDTNRGSINRSLTLALQNPLGGATLGIQPTSVLTIEALTSALSFTVPAYSVIKNVIGGNATITLTRTGSSLGTNQVAYATSDGTGVAGTDYVAVSGVVNWADGDIAPKTFPVPIINNLATSGNKTVNLTLSNPKPSANATLGLLTNALLTIIDNQSGSGSFNFVTSSYTVPEVATNLVITVVRTNGSSGAVSVNFATSDWTAKAGTYYGSTNGTLSFADGQTVQSFSVPIYAGAVVETSNTSFNITLSGPTGGASLGSTTLSTVTIVASDCYIAFSASSYNVNEAQGIATVNVQRIGGLGGAVSLNILAQIPTIISPVNTAAVAGLDFIALTTNVTINAGATNFILQVPIIDNLRVDGPRDIEIDFSITGTTGNSANPQGPTSVLLTIIDNDFPGGLVDNTFNLGFGPNTNVNAMALQADSKVIIGGEFTLYNGSTVGRIARVNTNGILDAAFTSGTGANNTINALALDNNTVPSLAGNVGKAVVGGLFTTYNGAAANRIARLNLNGTLDNTFNVGAGPNNSVFAVAVQNDGKVLVGGLFSSVGGVSRNFLARLNTDGSVDTSFMNAVTGPNNAVRSIAVDQNGAILIGGNFTVVNGKTRNRLARLNPDGSLDTTFLDPSILSGYATLGADGTVFAVYPYPTTGSASTTGDVLIGGQFSNFNGQVANHIVRLDSTGQADPSFQTGANFGADDFISTLLVQQYMQSAGQILVGGGFANFNGVPSGGIARLNVDGTLDPTINFGSGFNDVVSALAERVDGRLYVGGNFTTYNGAALNHLAVLQAGLNTDNGVFNFSSDTYDFVKGTGTNYITVVRSSGLAGAVSVDYTDIALGSTAVNGVTYNFTPGTLQFANGQAIGTIPINILSTNVVDVINPRIAQLVLSNPVGGATLGVTNYALVNIFDNNSGVDFLVHDFSVSENGGFAVISVQRTGGTNSTVTVNYSTILGGTAPLTEYVSASGTLTFNPGETLKTFNETIKDILLPGDQTVFLQLSNPTGPNVILGTNSPAVLTIFSDVVSVGALGFSTNAVSVNDSSTLLPVTVVRTGGNTGATKVSYATHNGSAIAGTDYTATSGTLSFADGDTVKTFNIPILRNTQITGNRQFNVTLSNPTAGATLSTSSETVTIVDVDGVVQFSSPAYTVLKNGGNALITVNCSGVLTTNISVTAATSNGSAVSGINYQGVTTNLVFGPGTNSINFNVPIINDGQPDGNQTVNLSLSGLAGLGFFGPVTNAVLTIQEVNSGVMFSAASYSVNESGGFATISVNRNGATNTTVGVNFSTSNGSAASGSNYVATNGTLTFGPGVTSQTFSVQVLDDQIVTPTLTVNLALNLPTGGAILIAPSSAVLNLLNSDVNYQFSTNSYSVLKTGANVQVTVLRTGLVNQATSVNFSTSNGTAISGVDYTTVNQVLNFGVGVTSRVVTVPIINDGIPTGNLFANLTLSNPTVGTYLGSPAQATLNIVDTITLIQFTAATNSVLEGTTNAMVYVSRSGATNQVNTVSYFTTAGTATAGLDYTATNGTLTFAPGQTNQLIQVPILDDMLPEQTETFTVSLANPTGGATLGAVTNSTVRIVDNDRIGSLDSSFEPGTGSTNTVYAITTQFGTNVIAGGNFRYLNGISRNRLARLLADGTVDLTFTNSFADNIIYAVAEQTDGKLLIGGAFTNVNGFSYTGLARLNADGSLDTNFTNHLSANSIVLSIAVSTNSVNAGEIAIGGQFTAVDINSKTNINIALVDTNGAINTSFTARANDLVEVVTFDQNSNLSLTGNVGKVLVGGFFTQLNGPNNAAQLARLNTDGSLDGSFIPAISPGARVYAIVVQPDGNVLVGGAFTTFNGVSHNNVARLDATGTVVNNVSFNNTGTDSTVYTMSLQSNGRVVVGGDFAYMNGVGRSHFARLNADGTLDATFDPGTALDNTVYSVATQPDGKVLLAGAFTTYDGVSRNGVARANGDHGQFQFAVSALPILKSAGPAVIQVTRLGGSSGIASVNFFTSNGTSASPAIAGTDYTATNGVLVFADSVTTEFITVPISNNTVVQPNHDFTVTLTNPTNSTLGSITNLTVTIVNDASSLQLSTNAISINEDQASLTLTVNRVGYLNNTGTVNYATVGGNASPGVNYTSTNGTLTFGTNVASQTIVIPIIHDTRVTGNKTFNLVLSGTTGQVGLITPSSCTVTVVDVDSYLQFATAATSSNETQPDGSPNSATLEVVRIGATNSAVSVQVYTADGTGVANTQYLPIPPAPPSLLTFLAGQATNYVTVTNLHDFQLGNKTFSVILANPSNRAVLGNPATNMVTIIDSDSSLSFAATNYTVVKSAGSINVTVLRGGSTNELVAVTAYTTDGTGSTGARAPGKYTAVTTKLTFAPGVVSQTFPISIVPNNIIDGTQSFTVGLQGPGLFGIITPPTTTTVTILDNNYISLLPAGTALTAESFLPANLAIDPSEVVTVSFGLRNAGNVNTTNVVATLLSTNGIVAANAVQSYGPLIGGGATVSQSFTFQAVGPTLTATFQLNDIDTTNHITNNLGIVSFPLAFGSTKSFTNSALMNIPATLSLPGYGPASIYPSPITVSGLTGKVSKVTVTLNRLTHTFPQDISMLLVSPSGEKSLLISREGGGNPVTNVVLTIDGSPGIAPPTQAQLVTGSYAPASSGIGETFSTPAPARPYVADLTVFTNINPNGVWSLYVYDNANVDYGSMGGWTLNLTTIIAPAADLSLTLVPSANTVLVGNNVLYTMTVSNQGPNTATGVLLTNTYPAGVALVSATNSQGVLNTNTSGLIWCALGNLSSGAVATVTTVLSPAAPGTINSYASVVADQSDPNLTNNTASVSVIAAGVFLSSAGYQPQQGQFGLTLSGVQGHSYVIQVSTNLIDWLPINTNVVAAEYFNFTDTNSPSFRQRFYRAIEQ